MDAQELTKALDERDAKLDDRIGAAVTKALGTGLTELTKKVDGTVEALAGLTKAVEDQGARLQKLEDAPEPGRAMLRTEAGKVVQLGTGATDDGAPDVSKLSPAEAALALTKYEHRHPKRGLAGGFLRTA